MTRRYEVAFEIAGPLAMFARPDTGATPTSFPAPTWSAAKGMFEAIAWLKSGEAWIDPTHVEICRRIGEPGGEVRFQRYTTNYGGPERKGNQLTSGLSFQLIASVLADVCYRLYGVVREGTSRPRSPNNVAHFLQQLFQRRIRQGRCFRTPFLGWSEFTASYWGPFRDGNDGRPAVTERDTALNLSFPSMLHEVFSPPINGQYAPRFLTNVEIREGLLEWPSRETNSVTRTL